MARRQPLERLESGQSTVSVVPPPVLQMYLDEDRDGRVDSDPAQCSEWQWGESERGKILGAIIMVKTRDYQRNEEVVERSQLKLSWQLRGGKRPENWSASLTITENANKIRIFSSRAADARPLLGKDAPTNELDFGRDLARELNDHGVARLWMEAVEFPQKVDESDACVTLMLTFSGSMPPEQEQEVQYATLRIAPWIMASDLDPTHKVFARMNEEGDNALAEAIKTWVGDGRFTGIKVAKGQPAKGFARDVAKCGHAAAPGFSQVVIQEQLDMGSPLRGLPARSAKDAPAGATRQPADLAQARQTGQDNGGNLLVSPPMPNYPYGRIIYGGRPHAADFYHAQLLQSPVCMDSTWLRVGHIDEMLSFARCKDGSYRAFLMSPRLAYIMLRPLAGFQITGPSSIIDWATSVNDEMIRAGDYNEARLTERLETFPVPRDTPDPELYGHDDIEPVGFEENPVCPRAYVKSVPAVTDTFVVFRVSANDLQIAQDCLGDNYEQLKQKYEEELRKRDRSGFPFAQVRVQTRRFLQNFEGKILETLSIAQPPLDKARRRLEEMGFKDKIIEIPVLLRNVQGKMVGLTADSVNMLVLAQGGSSRCLVPKPFGPTAKGRYVYEAYLKSQLDALGIDHKIMADDPFHVEDGEIHCGTNQMPEPLAEDLPKWWKARPEPVEEPAPLPERRKFSGTLRVSLDGEPQVDQHVCTILMSEGYADRRVDFPVEGYEDEVEERPANDIFVRSLKLGVEIGRVTRDKLQARVNIGLIKGNRYVDLFMTAKKLRFVQQDMPGDEVYVAEVTLTEAEEREAEVQEPAQPEEEAAIPPPPPPPPPPDSHS